MGIIKIELTWFKNSEYPVSVNEIKAVINNISTKKIPGWDCFTAKFYKNLRDYLKPILLKFLKLIWKGKSKLKVIYGSYHCLDSKSKQLSNQKREVQTNLFNERRCENPQKIPASRIHQIFKKIMCIYQASFIRVMHRQFSIHKSTNVIHHINGSKHVNYAIISIDVAKAFEKLNIYSG